MESQASKDANLAAIALADLRERVAQDAAMSAAIDRATQRIATAVQATAIDRLLANVERKRAMRAERIPVNQPRRRR